MNSRGSSLSGGKVSKYLYLNMANTLTFKGSPFLGGLNTCILAAAPFNSGTLLSLHDGYPVVSPKLGVCRPLHYVQYTDYKKV